MKNSAHGELVEPCELCGREKNPFVLRFSKHERIFLTTCASAVNAVLQSTRKSLQIIKTCRPWAPCGG